MNAVHGVDGDVCKYSIYLTITSYAYQHCGTCPPTHTHTKYDIYLSVILPVWSRGGNWRICVQWMFLFAGGEKAQMGLPCAKMSVHNNNKNIKLHILFCYLVQIWTSKCITQITEKKGSKIRGGCGKEWQSVGRCSKM